MNKKFIVYIGNDFSKRSNYNSTMNTLTNLLNAEGYKVVRSSGKRNKMIRLLAMNITVIKYARTADYVLIDTFSTLNFYYALIVSQLARILRLKYIPILHGGDLPNRLAKNPLLSKFIFKYAYKNIAPSLYLKTHFEMSGYPTEHIPNVIEIKEYIYKERKHISPKLLWVRAFDDIYNPKMAIEVLHLLKKRHPNAKLCMVGPQKDKSQKHCKDLVYKYGLSDSVIFTGLLKKEEWHELSKNYDIFINTTNIDNTPVSVMEAMALGLPVVSTNVGGLPFLINDTIDGILVEKGNPEMMAQAIEKLMEDYTIALPKNARTKVEGFTWAQVKKQWFSVLE